MTVLLLGANHDTATVAVRECLTISPDRIADSLHFLKSTVGEVALISTCNRTEFYAVNPVVAEPALRRFLHGHAGLNDGELDHALYRLEGEAAVRHLMRVACGLDSMILGEPQILGQVREAWRIARDAGSLGPVTDALFRAAINSGKSARSRTGISSGAVSVSHAAVEFARERFGSLAGRTVLVLGAGETGSLVARNLRSNGAGDIIVANRTVERAEHLAASLGARAGGFDQLTGIIQESDIVITCTGSPEPILTRDLLETALTGRAGHSLMAIDIAVPRDIARDTAGLPGINVFDLDDLQMRASTNRIARQDSVAAVEAAIDQQVREFQSWYTGHTAAPTIRAVRERAEEIRQAQVDRALRRLPHLDDQSRQAVQILSEQLVNTLLHTPISQLRDPEHGPANAAYLRALFGLDPESDPSEPIAESKDAQPPRSVA